MWCTTRVCVGINFFKYIFKQFTLFSKKIYVFNFAGDTTSFVCYKNLVAVLDY